MHLTHPRSVLWRDLAQAIAQKLGLHVASFKEWSKALHALMDEGDLGSYDMKKSYPLIRILPYAEPFIMYATNTAVPILDMTKAMRLSPTLRDPAIPRLDRTVARNWSQHLGLMPTFGLREDCQYLARL